MFQRMFQRTNSFRSQVMMMHLFSLGEFTIFSYFVNNYISARIVLRERNIVNKIIFTRIWGPSILFSYKSTYFYERICRSIKEFPLLFRIRKRKNLCLPHFREVLIFLLYWFINLVSTKRYLYSSIFGELLLRVGSVEHSNNCIELCILRSTLWLYSISAMASGW